MQLHRQALPEWLLRPAERVAGGRSGAGARGTAPVWVVEPSANESGGGSVAVRRIGPSRVDAARRQALYEACLAGGDAASRVIGDWLLGGIDPEDAYLEGIAPVARTLGQAWCDDRLDFAEVTLGSMRLQQLLLEWSPAFVAHGRQDDAGRCALLLTEFGTQHTLGAVMLGDFFTRAGWRVLTPLADGPQDPLRQLASDWVDLLALSVSSDRQLVPLRGWIQSARAASANPRLAVMVGGPMAALHPDLARALGADACGCSARDAPAQAAALLPPPAGPR